MTLTTESVSGAKKMASLLFQLPSFEQYNHHFNSITIIIQKQIPFFFYQLRAKCRSGDLTGVRSIRLQVGFEPGAGKGPWFFSLTPSPLGHSLVRKNTNPDVFSILLPPGGNPVRLPNCNDAMLC